MTKTLENRLGFMESYRPAKGSMAGDVYDRLQSGDVMPTKDVRRVADYSMMLEYVGRSKTEKNGYEKMYRLIGEWHNDEFYPISRVHEIDALEFFEPDPDHADQD